MPRFGMLFTTNRKGSSEIQKASYENRKDNSEEAEGFFRTAFRTSPKNGAALLRDLLELAWFRPSVAAFRSSGDAICNRNPDQ